MINFESILMDQIQHTENFHFKKEFLQYVEYVQ